MSIGDILRLIVLVLVILPILIIWWVFVICSCIDMYHNVSKKDND